MTSGSIRIPEAPRSIQKGVSLQSLLDREAIECLAHNVRAVFPGFDHRTFRRDALNGLESLAILQRGQHLAEALRKHLPSKYSDAVSILLTTLPEPMRDTEDLGLGGFFFLPYVRFVATYGLDPEENGGADPFDVSMRAQYEITRRFTAEFSMRPYLVRWPERTLERLMDWTKDPDPHVRRLCSEGARPRLPWAMRIPAFIQDPTPVLPILEALKDDVDLYVRRSVANHVGDIAKDHPELAYRICRRWAVGASEERKWMIRHAVRLPAKKGVAEALKLREMAKRRAAKSSMEI